MSSNLSAPRAPRPLVQFNAVLSGGCEQPYQLPATDAHQIMNIKSKMRITQYKAEKPKKNYFILSVKLAACHRISVRLSVFLSGPFLPARRFASAVLHVYSYGRVSVSLYLSCVCLSVSSRSSIETAEQIELVFGIGASFHPSYTVLK